jgi:mannose PTS system EIIA component
MIGTLVLTHGGTARELVAAAQKISGSALGVEALCLEWDDTVEAAREKVSAAIIRLDQGDGVLILTDMFGGTPSNIATAFFSPGKVEVLAGVNLPMVLRLSCRPAGEDDLTVVAEWLQKKAEQSHCLASARIMLKKCGDPCNPCDPRNGGANP